MENTAMGDDICDVEAEELYDIFENWDFETRRSFRERDTNHLIQIRDLKREVEELKKQIEEGKRREADCHQRYVLLDMSMNELKAENAEVMGTFTMMKSQLENAVTELRTTKTELISSQKNTGVLQTELLKRSQEAKSLAKRLQNESDNLNWEKIFRQGQQRDNEKLRKEIAQKEHDLEQARTYQGLAERKFKEEQIEVQRERAQRLIDLQQIKLSQVERDEMEKLASDKVEQAKVALIKEAEMKSIVEPLKANIDSLKKLAAEDATTIGVQGEEIGRLKAQAFKDENTIDDLQVELKTIKRKMTRQQRDLGSLQCQLSRYAKSNTERAALVSGGFIRGKTQFKATPTRGPTFLDVQIEPLDLLRPDSSGAKRMTNNFAKLLQECTEQLDSRTKEPMTGLSIPPLRHTTSEGQHANHDKKTKKVIPRAKPVGFGAGKGATYIGHGLGFKKDSTPVNADVMLRG
uniref:Uncharacterized protein n=1 Tax=Mucochytrium quahogii TaxID=96639 RepID=A0A7S2S047_9STRA|mmetsp:Transcript_19330/g.32369  ORF Transcript_19330/g.32369 Transcript_19330/m.32369 type:complete len:463 (-) Transcript_19330:907-2295(-)